MGRSVGAKAAQAVAASNKAKAVVRTWEQILKDIRNSLTSGLSITHSDVKDLLAKHDELLAKSKFLGCPNCNPELGPQTFSFTSEEGSPTAQKV